MVISDPAKNCHLAEVIYYPDKYCHLALVITDHVKDYHLAEGITDIAKDHHLTVISSDPVRASNLACNKTNNHHYHCSTYSVTIRHCSKTMKM